MKERASRRAVDEQKARRDVSLQRKKGKEKNARNRSTGRARSATRKERARRGVQGGQECEGKWATGEMRGMVGVAGEKR
jgi:hypothetical protein